MSRATLAFFCLPFSWSIIFHLLTLNLCLSSELNLLNSAYRWVLFLNTSSHSVSFDWWYQSIYLGLSQTDKYIALVFCVWGFFVVVIVILYLFSFLCVSVILVWWFSYNIFPSFLFFCFMSLLQICFKVTFRFV